MKSIPSAFSLSSAASAAESWAISGLEMPADDTGFGGWSIWQRGVAALLAALFIVARMWDLNAYRPWFDEIFSLQAVHRGWFDVLPFIATYDPHPPFWYLLLKAWTTLAGESYVSLCLFAVLPAAAMLIPFFLTVRALKLNPAPAHLALAVLAVNGSLIGSARELRMYSLLACLALWSMWLFIRRCNDPDDRLRSWVALTIVNILLVSTQYYGWLTVGAEGLFLLLWDRRKFLWFVGSAAAVVAANLPWAGYVVYSAWARVSTNQEAIAFTARPTPYAVAAFYAALTGTLTLPKSTTIALLIFVAPILLWAVAAVSGRVTVVERRLLLMLAVFALAPVVVAVVASLLLPFSVWGQRHLIIVAVPYVLLVAVAIDRLPLRPIRALWLVAGVVWISAAGVSAARTPYNVAAWDVLVEQLADSNAEPKGTTIYALNSSAAYVTRYYLQQIGAAERFPSVVIRRADFSPELPAGAPKKYWQLVLPTASVTTLDDLPLDHFWLADDGGDDGEAASAWSPGDSARTILQQHGFRVGEGISGTVVVRRGNSRRVELFPVWRGGRG